MVLCSGFQAFSEGVKTMAAKNTIRSTVRRRGIFYTVRSKILVSFGLLLVIVVVLLSAVRTFGIPFTSLTGSYGRERDQAFRTLSLVADLKKERLVFWLAEKKSDARVMADTREIELCVRRLRETFEESQRGGGTADRLPAALVEQASYRTLNEYFQLVLATYSAYQRIQAVDPNTGVILFSTEDKEAGTQIGDRRALFNAMSSAQGITVEVSKAFPNKGPYLIIYASIPNRSLGNGHEEIPSGMLLFYIDADDFLRPLLYAGVGLGRTGDIVLVDQDRRTLLQPRYLLPDGTRIKELRDKIESEPARLAVSGNEGIMVAQDYRGVPVVAAYRHVMVTPDTWWGLIVKRDKAEVFQPIWQGLIYSLAVGMVGMAVGLALAMLITNKISRPIEDLSQTASEVDAGNLGARAKGMASGQVGDLVSAFNSMVGHMENWYKELDKQVRERTSELARERERLAVTLCSIGDGVITTDTQGHVLSLNTAAEKLTGWPEKEALGRPVEEVFHIVNEKTRKRCDNPVWRVLQSGGIVGLANDTLLIGRDGTERILADSGAPIRTAGGVTLGVVLVFRDVTERKRAQEMLLESEEKYRLLVEESFDGIFLQQGTKIVFANSRLCEMLGYRKGELEGLDHWLVYHPDYQEITRERAQARMRGESVPSQYEVRLQRKDGTSFDGEINARATEIGGKEGIQVWVKDIGERKKMVELLKAEKENFQVLADNAPFGMAMIGEDGAFKYVNPKLVELFGYHSIDIPTGRDWFRKAFPDPDERHEAISAWINDSASARPIQPRPRIFTVTCKDGSRKIVHFRPVQLLSGDHLMTCEDITERRRAEDALRASEERYRSLFEESTDGIFITQRDGVLIDANKSYLDLFGYDREGLVGASVLKTYTNPSDWNGYRYKIEEHGYVKDYPITGRKKDGTEMECLLTASVQRAPDGTILSYRGIVRDITHEKALEKQLLQAQKMEAIGTLAGGVAHDFNNLLQVVLGYSELLLKDQHIPAPSRDRARRIGHVARTGADLVQRLLTFSRKTEIKPRPIDLNGQIRQVRQLLSRTIPKMIEIELILAPDLAAINADPSQIEQVLMNLTLNSKDAMPEGGHLIIETENVTLNEEYRRTHLGSKPGVYVLLSVSDTGSGMERETVERIFEPFYTTKGPGEGTGLGLAMVYGIVKQHGGYIMCYSEPGEGTTFKIYFPALVSDIEDEQSLALEYPSGGTETILLVDDEELICDLGKEIFQEAGYSVLTASNGREALELYEREPGRIALVVLDLIMPGMGGKQCLEELLRFDPEAKVLVASGYSMNGPTREALAVGARGFIPKPYDMRQLLQTVRDVLDT